MKTVTRTNPTGEEVLRKLLAKADRRIKRGDVPKFWRSEDCPQEVRLAALCRECQRWSEEIGKDDFPLAASLAAMVLGIRHEWARSSIRFLCQVGVLELTEQGGYGAKGTSGPANKYRYINEN